MDYKFYDTSSLLLKADNLFDEKENIVISSITLQELEHIKTSSNKDAEIKCAARHLLKQLDKHMDKYDVVFYQPYMSKLIEEKGFEITSDMKILSCAIYYDTDIHPDETIFITNDLALKQLANLFFGQDSIMSIQEEETDNYTGYLELTMSGEEMNYFYSHLDENIYNLYINQYLIIRDKDTGEIADRLYWTGEGYGHLDYEDFYSR